MVKRLSREVQGSELKLAPAPGLTVLAKEDDGGGRSLKGSEDDIQAAIHNQLEIERAIEGGTNITE